MPGPKLKTRPPTGKPSWPLILLAGEAKTGKTYRAAEFTGDERVGRSFFLDLGEGCADEYAEVPGANYEVIDHDGTWVDIIGQVEAVRDYGRGELAAGRKPIVLIVDSMTAEWSMLSAWADKRARRSKNNRKLLAEDPDAEIDVTSNYWNDSTSRHNQLMNILKTFPGIAIMTTLETEKTQFGAGGRPLEGAPKVAKPDGQKRLGADSSVWVRLSLSEPPTIVGMRAVRRSIVPGKDKPSPWPDFTIGKLVFEFLGLGADTAQVRHVPQLDADQVMPGEGEDQRGPQTCGCGDYKCPTCKGDSSAVRPAPRSVDAPSPAVLEKRAASAVAALLDAASEQRVEEIATGIASRSAGELDATAHLTDDDRSTLGIDEGDTVTVDDLLAYVTGYWGKHGHGPRQDEPVAAAG